MSASPVLASSEPPLCVDLDGTLTRTDTLAESILGLVKRNLWALFLLPLWVLKGRAAFKARIAGQCVPDPALLPYDENILADLREQHERGRTVVLVTAANQAIANAVAGYLKVFSRVFASDDRTNLKGSTKAAHLVQAFGAGGFDYIGDSAADIPVWKAARHALLARSAPGLQKSLERKGFRLHRVYGDGERSVLTALPKMLRLHQWVKNGLIFVPLVTSLSLLHVDLLLKGALAFLIFGMTASSVYVTNDLLDLAADRRHARKRLRPFASGRVSPWIGLAVAPTLLIVSLALSITIMPLLFTLVLLGYLVATLAYSLVLKQVPLIDVVVLALLYTLRIIAGACAVSIVPSFWLLAFSVFIFLSLALIKRFTELQDALDAGVMRIAGRGYRPTDLRLLMSLGTSAGYVAVLVLALYIDSEEVTLLYRRPVMLWMLCPLMLYWVARMWMQAERSKMHDDPVVFAAKDRVTQIVVALSALSIIAAAWPY